MVPGPTDGPAVVFEAGAAASRSSWAAVQSLVAGDARTIVYDRSGLSRSAPDPSGRTLRRMTDELGSVLDHVAPGPFILAGHSAGGPIARLAVAVDPERVAGLVLVDPADEAADVLFGRSFRRAERLAVGAGAILVGLRLLGFFFRDHLRGVPDDVRDDLRREAFTPGVIRTRREQARTFLDELAQWRALAPVFGRCRRVKCSLVDLRGWVVWWPPA